MKKLISKIKDFTKSTVTKVKGIFSKKKEPEVFVTPESYFQYIKNRKHKNDSESLQLFYKNCEELYEKFKITNQKRAIDKLQFLMNCVELEKKVIEMGFDTFVYSEDIEYYINDLKHKEVKICDLASYEREIPDDVIEIIKKVKGTFTELYIVFTDYTGKEERQVAKEKREKDPILFGVFQDRSSYALVDRFYYLADWTDDQCDLTFEKMVNDMSRLGKRNIVHKTDVPESPEDISNAINKIELDALVPNERNNANAWEEIPSYVTNIDGEIHMPRVQNEPIAPVRRSSRKKSNGSSTENN